MKPRIASKKLHGVTLISVDQYQYILKQVLHRKRQDMFLLSSWASQFQKWFSVILNYQDRPRKKSIISKSAELTANKETLGQGEYVHKDVV